MSVPVFMFETSEQLSLILDTETESLTSSSLMCFAFSPRTKLMTYKLA